jgi:hypothetical protein
LGGSVVIHSDVHDQKSLIYQCYGVLIAANQWLKKWCGRLRWFPIVSCQLQKQQQIREKQQALIEDLIGSVESQTVQSSNLDRFMNPLDFCSSKGISINLGQLGKVCSSVANQVTCMRLETELTEELEDHDILMKKYRAFERI